MRRVRTLLLLLLLLLLTGCAEEAVPAGQSTETTVPAGQSIEETVPAGQSGEEVETAPAETPDEAVAEGPSVTLPDESKDAAEWSLLDFAPDLCGASCVEERYAVAAGTEWENTITLRRGGENGATVYIIGGIHGDETAGWTAANLLREVCPRAGTVYVLSPANVYGAEHDQRTTKSMRDLNRSFPGDPEGWDAERIAASIYGDIAERRPDIVLDLHETRGPQENAPERDDLRNSIIVNDVSPIGELIWALTVDGVSGEALTLLGSPPEGSVNRTVSEQLGIPVITLETWRTEPLSARVARQIAFTEAVLRFYGLL